MKTAAFERANLLIASRERKAMSLSDPMYSNSALRNLRIAVQKVGPLMQLCGLVLALSACGDRKAEAREEARSLLTQLNALSGEGGLAERRAALDALKQARLSDPAHIRTRDVCHTAHMQLLDAEIAQATARKALGELTLGAAPGAGSLPPERSQAIAAELERSNQALGQAKRNFPACEEATQKLVMDAH